MIKQLKDSGTRSLDFRRARTRTLIQLGGLLEKSGIADLFGITLGQDLQRDDEISEEVAAIMGALVELKSSCGTEYFQQQKLLWAQKGKASLAKK